MWIEFLRRFRVARLSACFEIVRDSAAPSFPGAAFRGALGRALRRAACGTAAPSCTACPLASRCAYGYLFETPVPRGAARMRRYPYAPHPLVLRPPAMAPEWREGANLLLEVILFGRGTDYLPFVLYALQEMGREGVGPERTPLLLRSADLLSQRPRRIYEGLSLAPGPYASPAWDLVTGRVEGDLRLSFVTPTRIVFGGELARDLPLHVVTRALLRRVSSLAHFHEGIDLDLDFAGLVERASRVPTRAARLSWVDEHRHSARQGRAQTLGGAIGEVDYAGVPAEIGDLLALGELCHVGKATAFGFGRLERRAA